MAIDQTLGSFTPDVWNLRQAGDWLASSTIGVAWRSVSGTVDPWTKDGMIDAQAQSVAMARGTNQPPTDADYAQAMSDVTQVLKANKADPTDFDLIANNPGLVALVDILKTLGWFLIAGGIGYLLIQVLQLAGVISKIL